MEELARKFAEYLGDPYVAAVGYGALAYGFFHWLDEKASDEAKAALARTMRFKDYKSEQIASALVEVFDRIYTYPLLRWRAFTRSALFTLVITAIFFFEMRNSAPVKGLEQSAQAFVVARSYLGVFLVNTISDYLSLFVTRSWLARAGNRPAFALIGGTLLAALVVIFGGQIARILLIMALFLDTSGNLDTSASNHDILMDPDILLPNPLVDALLSFQSAATIPALAVLTWLPLFALGIVVTRALTPLSWVVRKTQWFLKEGKEHPLKAIGYVAAVVVFLGTVAGRAVFKA